MTTNCWEYRRCGREPGGLNTLSQGVCPTHSFNDLDGKNGGQGGGRCCWRVPEPKGVGPALPHWSDMDRNCLGCDFFKRVSKEQGASFIP
ncbi:MAG: hypothetical protein MUC62_08860 [Candidatus Thermoplasmatota archaeon]|jgi:hypothetical protein|nr:hypothetical protein [Candidatus Thermoplasmatota archaeon]